MNQSSLDPEKGNKKIGILCIYRNIQFIIIYCSNCKDYSQIIDNKSLCCNDKYEIEIEQTLILEIHESILDDERNKALVRKFFNRSKKKKKIKEEKQEELQQVEKVICANPKCKREFKKLRSNHIFCNPVCKQSNYDSLVRGLNKLGIGKDFLKDIKGER